MSDLIRNTTGFALEIAKHYINPNGLVIDATCGGGRDTLALAGYIWPDEVKIPAGIPGKSTGNGLTKSRAAYAWNVKDSAGMGNPLPVRLIGMDIQKDAVDRTRTVLLDAGFASKLKNGELLLTRWPHENIASLPTVSKSRSSGRDICLIMFNLGYLPGGDKRITTTTDSTLIAVRSSLEILSPGGLVCITMYSGHPEGAVEKRELLTFAGRLDPHKYHVSYVSMINQPNDPPEILLISRKR